jgi:predicted nucleotide-binding protein
MGIVKKDRLTLVSEFRDVIDGIARGYIIASGAYERLRRDLMQDPDLTDFLPSWLRPTRTSDEFKELLYNEGGDRIRFVKDSMEPALSYLEAFEFAPSPDSDEKPYRPKAVMPDDRVQYLVDVTGREVAARQARSGLHAMSQEVAPTPEAAALVAVADKRATDTRVFIVHGRDNLRRTALARFVERLGMQAVILAEQPDQGRTIIEKFEDHGNDADYAIVLMTPDDFGAMAGATPSPRARQNVVLELGYFMGRLGRRRVSALVVGEVERPSDVDGVLYVRWDDEDAWQRLIARNMKASGLDVDLNRL